MFEREISGARATCEQAMGLLTDPSVRLTKFRLDFLRTVLVLRTERLVKVMGSYALNHPVFLECESLITEIDATTSR